MLNESISKLLSFSPCAEGRDWLLNQKGSPQDIWNRCQRSDWMIWLISKLSSITISPERKKIIFCLCEIAKDVPFSKLEKDSCSQITYDNCFRTVEKYCQNQLTLDELCGTLIELCPYNIFINNIRYIASGRTIVATSYLTQYLVCNAALCYAENRDKKLEEYADVIRKHYPECPI